MEIVASVGSRVECENTRGTIKWVGEVPSTQGVWYGVDWDDDSRGKHDGSHKGEKYFETRTQTSGSFVRPTKVTLGVTLEEAVRERYQNDTTVDSQHTEQLQRTIKARFVEIVGMEKIGRKQSKLEDLETVVIDGWKVNGAGTTDLGNLFPRVQELNLSNSLLSSWECVAQIARQLPRLRFLDLSGNKLELPESPETLVESLTNIEHLVINNMIGYKWEDILTCCHMIPNLKKLQLAYNHLTSLGPIPSCILTQLEEIDVGANPIALWDNICHLGSLPRLESINANSCQFKEIDFKGTDFDQKTNLFPCLKNLTIAGNPLNSWDAIGNLNKLPMLENLLMTYDEKKEPYFQEFAFARIATLKIFNRSRVTPKERRDCELFYLKSFSDKFFSSGGQDEIDDCKVSLDFQHQHPNYMSLVKKHGPPANETKFKNQKLRDLKIKANVKLLKEPDRLPFSKSFLPTTKVAKLKMMLRRELKLNPTTSLDLTYCTNHNGEEFEIPIDNDMKEVQFYSISSGDTLIVDW